MRYIYQYILYIVCMYIYTNIASTCFPRFVESWLMASPRCRSQRNFVLKFSFQFHGVYRCIYVQFTLQYTYIQGTVSFFGRLWLWDFKIPLAPKLGSNCLFVIILFSFINSCVQWDVKVRKVGSGSRKKKLRLQTKKLRLQTKKAPAPFKKAPAPDKKAPAPQHWQGVVKGKPTLEILLVKIG